MVSPQEPPSGWVLEAEETTHDNMMGREYTTVFYRQTDTGAAVRLFEVLEAKANTWIYHVCSSGPNSDLGSADDLETAKEMALQYMTEYQAT